MSNYLLPADNEFIDSVAKAIAKNRLLIETSAILNDIVGVSLNTEIDIEKIVNPMFDAVWDSVIDADEQLNLYRSDARAAIAAINLKLLTMPQ